MKLNRLHQRYAHTTRTCAILLAIGASGCNNATVAGTRTATATSPNATRSANTPPAFLLGDFEDDYGARFTITPQEFFQRSRNNFHIVQWHVREQYFIAQNDSLNPSDANRWTRIDWLPLTGMQPFTWAFCFSAYQATTRAEADATVSAKRETPKTGCGGFPFSRMKRAEPTSK